MKLSRKILIFCPYYPPHIGGLENHADEFNKYLSPHIKKIVVFTPRLPQTSPQKEIQYNNIEIIRFPAFEIISNYPVPKFWTFAFWKIFRDLFKQDFDVVISRTRFFLTSLLALLYSKIKRKKWIHIEHGSDFVQLSSKLKSFLAKIYDYSFGFLIFKFSDLNISISKTVQKFVYKFDKRKSPVIYRGIDFEAIKKIQPVYNIKEIYKNKIIISFVGRLYKWKGVENTVKAIKLLPKKTKQKIVFLIVGDGEDRNRLESLSRGENSIVFLGNQPREKAIGILKISDIYIHSSLPGGGLSTSLLEAMVCGCKIIATPNEGANEVIKNGQNGILIQSSKTSLITKKLTELLPTIDSHFYKKETEKSIKEELIWERLINKYITIIEKITEIK